MNRKPQPFDVVSSDTMRDSDLLEAMLDTLEYYRSHKYKELIKHGRDVLSKYPDFGYISYLMDDSMGWTSELDYISRLINEDLWDAMQDISPFGCSFCSHFGDGALFGFWPDEDSPLWE